jgi:thiol-disulfide isomerase/thioredoxin
MKGFQMALSIVVFTVFSCANNSKGIEIKGKLQNAPKALIALDVLNTNGVKAVDSVQTNESGEFTLKYDAKDAAFYRLRTPNQGSYLLMCMSANEKVNISGDAKMIQYTAKVKGSPETEKMQNVNMCLRTNQLKLDSLNAVFERYANSPAQDSIVPILQAEYQNMQTIENKYIKNYIQSNLSSITCLTFIDRFDKDVDFALYKQLDEALFKALPTNQYVLDFHKKFIEMSKLMVGNPAPDFTLNTPEGTKVSLSQFKGKVLLVDFWASWCGPCRKENPNVVRIYNEYHPKGFEILSVSLDKSKDKWIEAIKADGLTWNHVSDLGFWQSAVVPLYNISGIPFTVLVDKDGNIAAKGLRGVELEQKVAELLSK